MRELLGNKGLIYSDLEVEPDILGRSITRLFRAVDAEPAIAGAGVVYIDAENRVYLLRGFSAACGSNPVMVILKEAPTGVTPESFAQELRSSPRQSRMIGELLGAGLSCSGALLAWLAIKSGAILLPFTGGLSTSLTVIGVAAATASALQCANGAGRVVAEIAVPEFKDWIDSREWYATTSAALDAISLTGAATAGFSTIRMVLTLRAVTGKSTWEVLQGLNRQERARLTKELVRINYPGISNRVVKRIQRSGQLPKRYANEGIKKEVIAQIMDAASGVIGLVGSGASGVVRTIAIGVYEEVDE